MTSDSSGPTASIHLDYDADSAPFDFSSLQICPRGMSLRTCWYFEPGSELSVNFQLALDGEHARCGRILRTEGVVVECRPWDDGESDGSGGYEVTVIFLEMTDDILTAIRELLPAEGFLHGQI